MSKWKPGWGELHLFDKVILFLQTGVSLALICSYFAPMISPRDFWQLAFAGLAYPYLAVTCVILSFYWLIRRYWSIAILFAVILVAGWNVHRTFWGFGWANAPLDDPKARFSVMSYNVRLFDLYNWTENKQTRNEIFHFLSNEKPDIICFQEFYYDDRKEYFNTRDTLTSILKTDHFSEYYTHNIHDVKYFGLCTFSKFPITDQGNISFGNDPNNAVLWTDIAIGNDTVRIFNAHLASIRFQKADYASIGDRSGEELYRQKPDGEQRIIPRLRDAFAKRASQSIMLAEAISKSPHRVIVCGDFNDTPVSYAYKTIGRGLRDAHKESGSGMGNTYIGKFPSFRIDYIFHSPELHSHGYVTHPEELSDHRAISCWIDIPN